MITTADIPLTDACPMDEYELLRRYHEEGDREARRLLAERMMPLVRRMARRYAGRGESLEDLVQVGSIGLIKAIDRFDRSRELRLSTFAVPTILGEIKRHFRDKTWSVRVPRDIQELSAQIARESDRLASQLGRAPTVDELAEACETDADRVNEGLQGALAYRASSLDAPTGEDGQERVERLGAEDNGIALAETRAMLADGFDALDPREKEIVTLRFFAGLTQREIADRVGVSQMHVSRLIRRSLDEMRNRIETGSGLAAAA